MAWAEAYTPYEVAIHPIVWPHIIHQRHRQTDNGPISQGEPCYKRSPKNAFLSIFYQYSSVTLLRLRGLGGGSAINVFD